MNDNDKQERTVNRITDIDGYEVQAPGAWVERWTDMSTLPDDFFHNYSAGTSYDFKRLSDYLMASAYSELQHSLPLPERAAAADRHQRLAENIGAYQAALFSVTLGAEFDRYSVPMLDLIRQLRARVAELEAAAESKPADGDTDGLPATASDGDSSARREPGSAREATS